MGGWGGSKGSGAGWCREPIRKRTRKLTRKRDSDSEAESEADLETYSEADSDAAASRIRGRYLTCEYADPSEFCLGPESGQPSRHLSFQVPRRDTIIFLLFAIFLGGRGGASALAVWADAGFSFGELGPLKSRKNENNRKIMTNYLLFKDFFYYYFCC